MTALPPRLCQVRDGLTTGRLPSWYAMQEGSTWGELTAGERTKRLNTLLCWLRALDCSSLSKEWGELSEDCATVGADAGALVLRAALVALRPIETLSLQQTKKTVTRIRDAAKKLEKALTVAQVSGADLQALTSGRALAPLVYDAAARALECVKLLHGLNQADANWKRETVRHIADQVRPPPKLLLAWLDELQCGCNVALNSKMRAPRRGKKATSASPRARMLTVRLADEFHNAFNQPKWRLAAALASAATGETVDGESVRTTESRN